MSDTPSSSSTEPKTSTVGSGLGQGTSAGAPREPRGFSQTGSQAQAAVSQAGAAISQGMDTAQARLQDLQDWAGQQHETVRERIRQHPTTTMAVTFGAGMLLGLLLSRR